MTEAVHRRGNTAYVKCGEGYRRPGALLATVTNTGNGYIAHFRNEFSSTTQDYYVCLDYAQAAELVQGLSMFKQELGFEQKENT